MELEFINVNYKQILKNITISFKKNEIISLIGQNGSGKSSFLDLIYAINKPDSGEIKINNYVIDNKIDKKIIKKIRKMVSYLREDYDLFGINILEDTRYQVSNKDEKKLYELFKLFNLEISILLKNYTELSTSEIKKISIINTILKDSKIILLDNPTSYLDNRGIEGLIKILKKEKRNDKIIIIVSNDSNFILSVSDKIMVLKNKNIVAFDTKYKIMNNKNLLKGVNMKVPDILEFKSKVKKNKNIKLSDTDNINDLIKDIYRNAK